MAFEGRVRVHYSCTPRLPSNKVWCRMEITNQVPVAGLDLLQESTAFNILRQTMRAEDFVSQKNINSVCLHRDCFLFYENVLFYKNDVYC